MEDFVGALAEEVFLFELFQVPIERFGVAASYKDGKVALRTVITGLPRSYDHMR